MMAAVARRPLLTASAYWLLLLLITHGTLVAAADVRPKAWPAFVLLAVTAYSAIFVAFTSRKLPENGPSPFFLRLALSASPTMVGAGLAFQGAASWALWTTVFACGVLLAASAFLALREQRPQEP